MLSPAKLQEKKSLKICIEKLKSRGKCIVFTNGCFDLIHPGHIRVLKEARSYGDVLIVGLNSDLSVKRIKGVNRPILPQKARATVLSAIRYVDYITIFDEPTPYNLIKTIRPDVLVKGGDWEENKIVGRQFVKKVVRIKPFKGYSTSSIIESILKKYAKAEGNLPGT